MNYFAQNNRLWLESFHLADCIRHYHVGKYCDNVAKAKMKKPLFGLYNILI